MNIPAYIYSKKKHSSAYDYVYLSHRDEAIIEVPYFVEQLLPWLESGSFAVETISYLSEAGILSYIY